MVTATYKSWSLTRGSKYSDFTWKLLVFSFGILEKWALTRGFPNRRFDCMRLTTSGCSQLLSVVLLYTTSTTCTTYLSVQQEVGAFCVECLEFPPPPPPFLLSTVYQFLCCVGAHGWVVKFCQPWVQSPSWS